MSFQEGQQRKAPNIRGFNINALWHYMAVLAVCCEPVSIQIPCLYGKIQGIFSQKLHTLPSIVSQTHL